MGDVVGRLFREFAITLAVTILISAVVSLTLVPMLCAQAAAPPHRRASGRGSTAQPTRASTSIIAVYDRALDLGAGPPAADADRRAGHAGADRLLYVVIPKGFFPPQDTGVIQGSPRRRRTSSFARWPSASRQLARRDPEGSGRRQPVVLHRRRRHQHDAEQRPLPDQPEAARRSAT